MGRLSLLLVGVLLTFSFATHHGVYFEKLANMVHTTEHHTVVLRLGFSSVLKDLGTLETKLLTALQHANNSSPFYPHFAQLVTTLRLNIH